MCVPSQFWASNYEQILINMVSMNYPELQKHDTNGKRVKTCLSCGEPLTDKRRRYCSQNCRGRLRSYLNRRTGLLAALNTRYATFYFNPSTIVMDVLPYGTEQIYSFAACRNPGKKPVDDFCGMARFLGKVWWTERDRTKKRYLASLCVLDKAQRTDSPLSAIIPRSVTVPAVKKADLKILSLRGEDLVPNGLSSKIKNAYRTQAKKLHPDLGGKASDFRRLQEAYEKLISWSRNPTFFRYSGFTDKWLYEGCFNRWIQPAAIRSINF